MVPLNDDGRSLNAYLAGASRRGWAILTGTLVAAGVTYVVSASSPKVYEATGTVVVAESKVADNAPIRPGGDYKAQHEIVRQLLVDRASLASVIAGTPELAGATPAALASAIRSSTLAYSPVVEVAYRAGSPEQAARTLNRVLDRAVALNASMATDELTGSRQLLGGNVDETRKALDAAASSLETFATRARVEERREHLNNTMKLRGVVGEKLAEARGELSRASGARAALVARLEGRSETVTLDRSILDDPAAQDAVRDRDARVPPLTVRSEELHPAVMETQMLLDEAASEEAGARAQVAALEAEIARIDREMPSVQADVARLELELDRLKTAYTLAQDVHKDAVKRLEAGRLQVATRMPDLRVLNAAVATSTPVSPRPLRNAIAAGAAAFLLCLCAAMLLEASSPRPVAAAAEPAVPLARRAGVRS